jgi:hypothetical protein
MTNVKLERFVVAVNDGEAGIPKDWLAELRVIPGVHVLDKQASTVRVMVTASPAGIVRLQEKFGDTLLVERVVLHRVAS